MAPRHSGAERRHDDQFALLEAARLHDAMAVGSVENLIVRFLGDCSDAPIRKALASTCKDPPRVPNRSATWMAVVRFERHERILNQFKLAACWNQRT